MNGLPIITISRQYGSGGRAIGKLLAGHLGIPYYDNELITLAAQESGFSPSLFANADQNASNSLLFSLSMYSDQTGSSAAMPLGEQVFLIQSNIIRQVAANGPCVLVGRCADYVLGNMCLNVFLHAPLEWRIQHAITNYHLPAAKAREEILKTDKKRAVYYSHFTGDKWGDGSHYGLMLDVSCVGVEGAAAVLGSLAHEWAVLHKTV
ncbi:MAG: cytidylate kinase-like family protein [Oscillospiraceae bacterium]